MHPVEEDSRFAIQPVYPDRQALCAEGEEHGKKNNLLVLEQVDKCPVAVPFPAGVHYF
jgi:hypothetical protein